MNGVRIYSNVKRCCIFSGNLYHLYISISGTDADGMLRFKPEGGIYGETSTYRGTIQLHASSWPKTGLTPWKPQSVNPQIRNAMQFAHLLYVTRFVRSPTRSTDSMWAHPHFWDFNAEDFLSYYHGTVEKAAQTGMDLPVISGQELEDIL